MTPTTPTRARNADGTLIQGRDSPARGERGRSLNPDEFAISLEQVVAGTAPEDYRDPAQFFARTCFTRALREHEGRVLRRLSGRLN
jgi:hypothetical protein